MSEKKEKYTDEELAETIITFDSPFINKPVIVKATLKNKELEIQVDTSKDLTDEEEQSFYIYLSHIFLEALQQNLEQNVSKVITAPQSKDNLIH